MALLKTPKNFKYKCLFNEVFKVGDIVKSNIARGKGKPLVNGAYFGLINFIETPLERRVQEIKVKSKKKKKAYDLNRKFQDAWIAKLPWAKNVVYDDTLVSHVK